MRYEYKAVEPFVYVPSKYEGIPGLIAIPISELKEKGKEGCQKDLEQETD